MTSETLRSQHTRQRKSGVVGRGTSENTTSSCFYRTSSLFVPVVIFIVIQIYLHSRFWLELIKNTDPMQSAERIYAYNSSAHSLSDIFQDVNNITSSSSKIPTQLMQESHRNSSEPSRPHPHAGARFSNGTWGYVADVYRVKRWMLQQHRNQTGSSTPSLSFMPIADSEIDAVCNQTLGNGTERRGWKILAGKVQVDAPNPVPLNSMESPQKFTSKGRILCVVYTHEGAHQRLPGITATWAWRCDGFLAASTRTVEDPGDDGFGAIDLPHKGPESYDNMWQKIRSVLSYLHDHFLDDFEYFYLGGDDTHLIVENLRNYLGLLEEERGSNSTLFVGQLVPGQKIEYFVGGGGGYILNRLTLKRLVGEAFPNCLTNAIRSSEDRFVSMCLKQIGVWGTDAADATDAQRFHGMDADFVESFQGNRGYFKGPYNFWAKKHGFKAGIDLVSRQSIAFHLLKDRIRMKRHHAILYRSCPPGTLLADQLEQMYIPGKNGVA